MPGELEMKRSIVLRGSLSFSKRPNFYAQNVIDSIRSWYDDELIVSTWHDQEKSARQLYGIDKIVLSTDPQPGPVQQMQRQLDSYYAGVHSSSGEQILVTRTDIMHFNNLFNYIGSFKDKTKEDLSCFSEKLIIGNIMSINPESNEQLKTFRVCDWFQCGPRTDIERWCSIVEDLAMISRQELQTYWDMGQICTEKLWFCLVLNKYSKYKIDWRNTEPFDHLAWHAIIDNFMILDQISTAQSINLNWSFQPQRLNCYVIEEDYIKKAREICA